MPTIVVPASLSPCQVTIPEEVHKDPKDPKSDLRKCERSKVTKTRGGNRVLEDKMGSLYIRPATTMHLTDDEWACLQAAEPALAKKLIVVENKRRDAMRKAKVDGKKPAPKADDKKMPRSVEGKRKLK